MLPMPTREPTVVAKAWKGEMPVSLLEPGESCFTMSLNSRIWGNFMRTENHMPAARHRNTSGMLHTMSFILFIAFTKPFTRKPPFV